MHASSSSGGGDSDEVRRVPPQSPQEHSFMVCGHRFDLPTTYTPLRPIGQGAYGCVCSALHEESKTKVAVKKLAKAFSHANQIKRTLREIRILRTIDHENVLRLRTILKPPSFEGFRDVYVVTDLLETDLHQIVASKQALSDDHIQYFTYQVLRGLKYIHSAGVMHRDLKPGNLLVNSNCELRICDFGLARSVEPDSSTAGFLTEYVATRWYRAPEIMLSWSRYTKAIDVWSVGCILAELLGGRPFLPGRHYMHQLQLIFSVLGTPSEEDCRHVESSKAREYLASLEPQPPVPLQQIFPSANPKAVDLLARMLTFDPAKRISVDDALKHPYLEALHDPSDEPVSTQRIDFSWEQTVDEAPGDGRGYLKRLLWEEIRSFHADLGPAPPISSDDGGSEHKHHHHQQQQQHGVVVDARSNAVDGGGDGGHGGQGGSLPHPFERESSFTGGDMILTATSAKSMDNVDMD